MNSRKQLEAEVQDALGFIALLQEARAAKLLAPHELNRSQFTLLFLLGVDSRSSWTISDLSQHMELQLPGISKIVSYQETKGWLRVHLDTEDGRKKLIRITPKGRTKREHALAAMEPVVSKTFGDWTDEDLIAFLSYLEKLKCWLDAHRNPLA